MTSLFAARRAAEEFAGLADGTRTDVADRYADLGDVLTLLRAEPRVEARPEFVADLRERLLAAATTELAPAAPALRPVPSLTTPVTSPRRASSARPHRLGTAAAAALVVVGGTTGVAAAASGALPGEGLYTVKRGIETATTALNTSDAGKGAALLRQAGTRLDEVEALAAADADDAAIRGTLADFQETATSGAGLLFRSYEASGDSHDISAVRQFSAQHRATLLAIADTAGAATSTDFAAAAATLDGIEAQALQLCGGCGGASIDEASSASALQTLLAAPAATRDQAPAAQPARSQLATAAEDAADDFELPPAPTASASPAPAPAPTSVLEPVEQTVKQVTGGGTGSLTGSVTGAVTGPVTGLVDQVGDATGLQAVTDPLTGLLNGLG